MAFLLAQVLTRSCRAGGLESLGGCLLGGLASLVVSGWSSPWPPRSVRMVQSLRPVPASAFADRIEALLED